MEEIDRMITSKINAIADQIEGYIIENRRDFHKYPESAWTEFRTASKVARQLNDMGYKVLIGKEIMEPSDMMGLPKDEVLDYHYNRAIEQGADKTFVTKMKGGFTSVMAELDLGEGPTVAFRFDMDAVDCDESQSEVHFPNQEGFRSENEKVMHACGHDCHTAIGLGFAKSLMSLKDDFTGKIKLIFQAAEEGVRGAKSIASKGVVDDVDYFFSMHIGTSAKVSGKLICGVHGFLATEKYDAVFKGISSHAGNAPNMGKNAILAACTAVTNLYSISRHKDGATRINVGRIEGGTGRNVIPNHAQIDFEVRGSTTDVCDYMKETAENIIKSSADMHMCEYEIIGMGSAESSFSDQEMIKRTRKVASELDIFEVIEDKGVMAGSEDCTYLMNRVREHGGLASYFILGTELKAPHHNDLFDVYEADMKKGIKLLLGLVYDLMNKRI